MGVDIKMVITVVVLMLLASAYSSDTEVEAEVKAEVAAEIAAEVAASAVTFEEGREEPQPQEANEGKRESKQLWPILASYYHQQGQSPIQYNWQYKQQFPKSASGGLTS